ncbi:hypothetical protein ASF84_07045 [Pseudomonas sp. Leaf127]|uniref:hypothetical protein n=1 Tax=Pseudomonas sp. Leaf127 TaxID=1736267 RepID=UPI000703A301|nr:hypothetical protein [Pseudomonas sp. Leaf127]KQQ56920.1 hypothetical protein ASF84_07045 [Pseudomonas sp. Leaf127]
MSSHSNRREVYVSLKLILCIALGIWLGVVAVVLTGLLLYKALPAEQTRPLEAAAQRLTEPPAAPVETQPGALFDKYQQSLRESEARQAREYADSQRKNTFNRAKCDFWLQQDRTAPSDKSRAGVTEFCG